MRILISWSVRNFADWTVDPGTSSAQTVTCASVRKFSCGYIESMSSYRLGPFSGYLNRVL